MAYLLLPIYFNIFYDKQKSGNYIPLFSYYKAARRRASVFSTLRTERGKKARMSSSL